MLITVKPLLFHRLADEDAVSYGFWVLQIFLAYKTGKRLLKGFMSHGAEKELIIEHFLK